MSPLKPTKNKSIGKVKISSKKSSSLKKARKKENVLKMDWGRLLSRERFCHPSSASSFDNRTVFEADVQRIIFSGVFRRLSKKTQVHPLIANDNVHTRLTHSVEVSQVGKILGKMVGRQLKELGELPVGYDENDIGAIVEAACLAHDLGNPPFGHAGEEAVKHWFENESKSKFNSINSSLKNDLAHFEGNAQGFRILTQTENYLFKGGMRLTYATLGTFMKYPWTIEKGHPKNKFGAFHSEKKILKEVASHLGLLKKGQYEWARHPLAFLVEAADDICYAILDLEDAVELKILTYEKIRSMMMNIFDAKEKDDLEKDFNTTEEYRVNLFRLRGRVFEKLINAAYDGFFDKYEEIMSGNFSDDVFKGLPEHDHRKSLVKEAKDLAGQSIYTDTNKVEIELGSYTTFETLLNTFCHASSENFQKNFDSEKIDWKSKLVMKMLGAHAPSEKNAPDESGWNEYLCLRRAIDFVSGMTDNYAVYVANQINGSSSSNKYRY